MIRSCSRSYGKQWKIQKLFGVDLDGFVWEWISTNYEWDSVKLRLHLPEDSVKKIYDMSPLKAENEDDKFGLKISIDVDFVVNITYKVFQISQKKKKLFGRSYGVGRDLSEQKLSSGQLCITES
ncbi:hypothetical protein AHAS_Ahas03G0262500 [Arachis hypogaea]